MKQTKEKKRIKNTLAAQIEDSLYPCTWVENIKRQMGNGIRAPSF